MASSNDTPANFITYNEKTNELVLSGDWNIQHLGEIEAQLAALKITNPKNVTLIGKDIHAMDSAGAWLLSKTVANFEQQKTTLTSKDFSSQHEELLKIVQAKLKLEDKPPVLVKPNKLEAIGHSTIAMTQEFLKYLAFIGKLSFEALRIGAQPKHWRWGSLSSVIYKTGFQGLPIIALLSFLIGVVITYQMGLQLRNYGANIYIVDLLGLAILREFAPLLTAIMVAGRTGSAYTASIGMMKLNQEIDALDTMGVTPAELLLLPRIIGLFISLPLLVMWADIFGVFGGMVMANNMLSISWYDFLHRFPHVIPLRSLLIGIGKAPVFALLISSIGCFEGMQVKNSADSVGENTTRSVVLAIFFIIVADAIFSIILSKMKL